MNVRPFEILLVEDSPADAWLTRQTLLEGSVPKNINVVSNGEQALDYLNRRGSYGGSVRPDLILLDLNLPRRDGLEVLREIKADLGLRSITVVVLTTSEAPVDVNRAYDLNANCYVVKPVDLESFTRAIRGIEHFWMLMASLPSRSPTSGKGEHADGAGAPSVSGNGPSGRVRKRLPVRKPRRIVVGGKRQGRSVAGPTP